MITSVWRAEASARRAGRGSPGHPTTASSQLTLPARTSPDQVDLPLGERHRAIQEPRLLVIFRHKPLHNRRCELLNTAAVSFNFPEILNGTATGDLIQITHFVTDTEFRVASGYQSGAPLNGTVTFPNQSIASVFGSNLDGGGQVAMWGDNANNTLYFVAVPEPSGFVLAAAGGLIAAWACAGRSRRPGHSRSHRAL